MNVKVTNDTFHTLILHETDANPSASLVGPEAYITPRSCPNITSGGPSTFVVTTDHSERVM